MFLGEFFFTLFTLPDGVAEKYCDKHACVCLTVCKDISGITHAIFTSVHVAYGHGSVLLRQGEEIPSGRGNFGVFLPTDIAL